VGASRCNVEHVGLVLSGCATAAMEDGVIHELRAGTLSHIPPGPPGHDSWVVGDVPYISPHFRGGGSAVGGLALVLAHTIWSGGATVSDKIETKNPSSRPLERRIVQPGAHLGEAQPGAVSRRPR
jgi:hypothetical protein